MEYNYVAEKPRSGPLIRNIQYAANILDSRTASDRCGQPSSEAAKTTSTCGRERYRLPSSAHHNNSRSHFLQKLSNCIPGLFLAATFVGLYFYGVKLLSGTFAEYVLSTLPRISAKQLPN